jgi:type II secretory pathway pseudopilin PulG
MKRRLRRLRSEEGYTLVELLVASMMGVVVMGTVALLVISAVKDQPKISKQAQNITTARWVLDRLTHEIRNGVLVTTADPDELSFQTYLRRSTCGGSASLASSSPAIKCQVTYVCTTTACSRRESPPNSSSGTPQEVFSGIDSNDVFEYAPEPIATEPASVQAITYVKVTLRLPNPSGSGALTVSSGASLRNATLGY